MSDTKITCPKCGSTDFGLWTSTSTGKAQSYCRNCRRQRARNYSARKSSNGGGHTARQWREKLAQYDRCPRCQRRWDEIPPRPNKRYKTVWTKDHVLPITLGGSDDISNIQPLCYQCNFSKLNTKC